MRRDSVKTPKCNAASIDAMFEIMFETLWVPTYDRSHGSEVLREFDRAARRLIVLLNDTDLSSAGEERSREIMALTECLRKSIRQMEESQMFSAGRCRKAAAAVQRIADQLQKQSRHMEEQSRSIG